MPAPYIHTPRTNDATYLTDQLDGISPEKSFAAPQGNDDLITQMRKNRQNGMNLKTPRVGGRDPLRLLPNGNQPKPEFTPLMRSVTRTNMAKRLSAKKDGPEALAYLRNSYIGGATPALPRMEEESNLVSEHTNSSVGRAQDYTPMPLNISSSPQSTPLVQLPARDAIISDGNMMTLREQENIIDKIEKENFGLKMKIHFLEDAIAKRGGEFNQAALRENTDLKVNRITMQRELHKFKKTLAQAERDAEIYRQQLEEYKERVRRKQMDENIRIEVESMRSDLEAKDSEVQQIQTKYDSLRNQNTSEIDKLRDEIADLQAELREKDRSIEDKDDELDALRLNSKKDSNVAADLEDELENARQQIEQFKEDLDRAVQQAREAREERERVLDEKRRAEEDLDELRDEMANKSFTTKGLSRQLEEKVDRLEDEHGELQEKCAALQVDLEEKAKLERLLQERLRETERESTGDARRLQQELETSQQQREIFERKYNNSQRQMESLEKELQVKTDEKNLLQVRHDALTRESAELQEDNVKSRKTVKDLEIKLDQERQLAAQNDDRLRSQHKHEVDLLNEQIDTLHREVSSRETDQAADQEEWESQKRSLEALSKRAEEKAVGLQRTVDKLQDAQGTLSGREMMVQEALDSEKQRHLEEEKILSKQIQELNQDLASKRTVIDENRSELNNAREELRISVREQAMLKEKVAELEDEIEVLQADIEQEHEFVQQLQNKSNLTADAQVVKLRREKQELSESLLRLSADLQDAQNRFTTLETERDELEARVEQAQRSHDDTFDGQQEKRDLRRAKQKLEHDLEKMRTEKDNLVAANEALEAEIVAEIDRASAEEIRLQSEIDQIKAKQSTSAEIRDRELISAKAKVERLEGRIRDLQESLDQSKKIGSPSGDTSSLRHDLAEARKSETATAKRESDLKAANRDLKMKINDLEKDLHEARLTQLKSRSPSVSPPPSHSKEVAQLRKELVDARAEVQVLQAGQRELKKSTRQAESVAAERDDFQARVRTSSQEVQNLVARLTEREDELAEVRLELQHLREERDDARNSSINSPNHILQIRDLKNHLGRIRAERDALLESTSHSYNNASVALSNRQTLELKAQLKRLREERTLANQKADAIEQELETLQSRYEAMLEKLTSRRHDKDGSHHADDVRDKEIKGLVREVVHLKAKFKREQRLRSDLAWSKAYLQQNEIMRSECNQIDLRIIRSIGLDDLVPPRTKYERPLTPKAKFRAGVFVVIAAVRLRKMEERWRGVEAKVKTGLSLKR